MRNSTRMPSSPVPPRVHELKIETIEDLVRITFLTAPHRVTDPRPARLVLVRHDEIAKLFWADIECRREDRTWVAEISAPRTSHPRLAEIARVKLGDDVEVILSIPTLYLEPRTDGPWQSGSPAEEELRRLLELRHFAFGPPLDDGTSPDAQRSFTAIAIADNWLATEIQQVPGMRAIPLQNSTLGSDLIKALNDTAAQLGFATGVDPAHGLVVMRRRRPAVAIHAPTIRASGVAEAIATVRRQLLMLLDIVSIRRGATPRLLGGMLGTPDNDGMVQVLDFWVEGAGYTGNLIGGFVSGEDQHSLLSTWNGVIGNPRAQLWLSLYSDAIADERWDYRLFRCVNLLEGIATEVISQTRSIADTSGQAIVDSRGQLVTTRNARGKIYELVKTAAQRSQMQLDSLASRQTDPERTMWDETDIWITVRNAVAHRGSWSQPQGATMSARDQRIERTIVAIANDGTFDSGSHAVVFALRNVVEMVLRTVVRGLI